MGSFEIKITIAFLSLPVATITFLGIRRWLKRYSFTFLVKTRRGGKDVLTLNL